MEVIFLKNHLYNVKGDKKKVNKSLGNYLVNCGVVSELKEETFENSEDGTKGISTRKTIEQVDREIKKLNKKK